MPYGFANLVQGGRQEIHCGVAVPRFQARGGEHERHSLCTYPAACPPPSKVVGARLCGRRAGICVARSRADLGEGRHSLREHGRREENASKNRDTYMGRQSMPGQQARRLKYDIASDEKSKKIRPTVRAIRAQVQRMGVTGYAISGLYPNFTPNKSSLCWCLAPYLDYEIAGVYSNFTSNASLRYMSNASSLSWCLSPCLGIFRPAWMSGWSGFGSHEKIYTTDSHAHCLRRL